MSKEYLKKVLNNDIKNRDKVIAIQSDIIVNLNIQIDLLKKEIEVLKSV